MNKLNQHKVALTVSLFLGGCSLIWILLVLMGLGQLIIDFILWAHMISAELVVEPFNIVVALSLIITMSLVGYILGYIFAYLWNLRIGATN